VDLVASAGINFDLGVILIFGRIYVLQSSENYLAFFLSYRTLLLAIYSSFLFCYRSYLVSFVK
jgi:hypothetical protein